MDLAKYKAKGKRKYWSKANRCPGYVYVFSVGFGGLYKIGWAKNYHRRLQELRAANPKLGCMCAVKVGHAKREEWNLHYDYWEKHAERELFCLGAKDLRDIYQYLWAKRLDSRGAKKLKGAAEYAIGTPAFNPCQRCGNMLVVRRNQKNGTYFLGCCRFPECRYTQRIGNTRLLPEYMEGSPHER